MYSEWVFFALLSILFLFAISIVIWTLKNGISPMPSSSKCKKALLALLPENLSGNIYELGSGWGTLAIPLAEKYPDCQVYGYETSPVPYWLSKGRLKCNQLTNLKLKRRDFFSENLHDASLIVCYLFPKGMERLKEKLEKELKPGAFVASHTFAFRGWVPLKVIELDDLYKTRVYLYRT